MIYFEILKVVTLAFGIGKRLNYTFILKKLNKLHVS